MVLEPRRTKLLEGRKKSSHPRACSFSDPQMSETPKHTGSGQKQCGGPFRWWCPEARPREGGSQGEVGAPVARGNYVCKAGRDVRHWCRAGGRWCTGEFCPRVSPQYRERPGAHRARWAHQGLGISSVGLGMPPLWLERNSKAARGTRVPMWGSGDYVVTVAFRVGRRLPDHPSGPTVLMHALQTQNHHPQTRRAPCIPRTSLRQVWGWADLLSAGFRRKISHSVWLP